MTFYEWLRKWAEDNEELRDMWGAMANHVGYIINDLPDTLWTYKGLARVFGFQEGTAEFWMYSELYMRWEDEVGRRR